MFKIGPIRTLLSLVVLAVLLAPGAVAAAVDDRIGVVLETSHSEEQDQRVLNAATAAFMQSRRFDVIERSRMDAILEEHDFQDFTGSAVRELGKLAGLDSLALVSYTSHRVRQLQSFRITARVVDVSTGQVLATLDSGNPSIPLLGAVSVSSAGRGLLESIKEHLPARGYVVKVEGDEVVVDLGSDDGLKNGDLLNVVQRGEDIEHPVTGEVVPGEERVVGTLKVRNVTPTTSLCRLKKEGQANLGDVVEFRSRKIRIF